MTAPRRPIPFTTRRAPAPWRSLALACAAMFALGTAPSVRAQAAAPVDAAASQPLTVRKEVGLPLQAAQELIRAGKGAEALARIAEAEAVPALTPFEAYMIRRNKAPAALGAGDLPGAIQAFESVVDDGFTQPGDKLPILDALARLSYQSKDHPRAVRWLNRYFEAGGNDPQLRQLLPNVLYLTEDHAGVVKVLEPTVRADAEAGRPTDDTTLRMLASSQQKLGDDAGYLRTLERIAAQSGKPDLWSEVIVRSLKAVNMAERHKLDYYRLRQATGGLSAGDEMLEMAYLANQAGLPGEADAVIKAADARGAFGTGAIAQQARQLRQQVGKALADDRRQAAASEKAALAAKDGNALLGLGFALSADGQAEKGAELMAQGLAKGNLKRPDEAMLHLGVAQWRAGKLDDAIKSFGAVQGTDGAAELARLWRSFVRSKSPTARN